MKYKESPVLLIYGISCFLVLMFRFWAVPWDGGGTWFQLWCSMIGIIFLITVEFDKNTWAQKVGIFFLLPLLILLSAGTIYFSPQALVISVLICAVLAVSLGLWSKNKIYRAILVLVLLVPLTLEIPYQLHLLKIINKLRGIHPEEVKKLELLNSSKDTREMIEVNERDNIDRIVETFKSTTPHSPVGETIGPAAWLLTVVRVDGSKMNFRISNGNKTYPNAIWIQLDNGLDNGVYQNLQLRDALTVSGINLWNKRGRVPKRVPF